jgi:transcriptional regulator with XRE-family HTH domain
MKLRHALGDTLKELRNEQGKTLRQISGKAGMALGYLSEVERGQKEASSEILDSLAYALNISVAELLILTAYKMSGGIPDTAETLLDEYADLVVNSN